MVLDMLEYFPRVLLAGRGVPAHNLLLHALDGMVQALPLVTPSVLHHTLHHIVAVGVGAHRQEHLRRFQDGPHQRRPLLLDHVAVSMLANCGDLEALLHHVAGVLLPGEVRNLAPDGLDDALLVLLAAVLQHMLHHVVAVGVLGQDRDVVEDLLQHRLQLLRGTVLQQALDHAAPVHMPCSFLRLHFHSFDDEVHGVRRHLLDALLDHVIPVHVPDALLHVLLQLSGDLLLRLFGHGIDGLLDHPAAALVLRQLGHVALERLDQRLLLPAVADVKDLLHHVVAKGVLGQVRGLRLDRLGDVGFGVWGGLVELGLQVAATVLVLGELWHQVLLEHLVQGDLPTLLPHSVQQRAQGLVVLQGDAGLLLGVLALGAAFALVTEGCLSSTRRVLPASALPLGHSGLLLWCRQRHVGEHGHVHGHAWVHVGHHGSVLVRSGHVVARVGRVRHGHGRVGIAGPERHLRRRSVPGLCLRLGLFPLAPSALSIALFLPREDRGLDLAWRIPVLHEHVVWRRPRHSCVHLHGLATVGHGCAGRVGRACRGAGGVPGASA
mmetsp:Transcript_79903/g.191906  ORF Transcript_79903/g.191906 Transcript_79903/m.191906 type:complete len:550 (+) Transcript_79903:293-1942(+)